MSNAQPTDPEDFKMRRHVATEGQMANGSTVALKHCEAASTGLGIFDSLFLPHQAYKPAYKQCPGDTHFASV